MARPRRIPLLLAATAAALLLLGAAASAQDVHEILPGGDLVNGTVASPGEVERIPFRLVEGSLFSLSLKAAKGSALLPVVTVLGPDRAPEGAFAAGLVTASKGNAVSLKNLAVTGTGLRWLEIRGKSGTTGGWQLKTKVKLPKKAAGSGSVDRSHLAGGTSWNFTAPGNATATLTVSAGKGSAFVPRFLSLLDPDGRTVLAEQVLPSSKGFVVKDVFLGRPGTHTLSFTADDEGAWTAKAAFKLPKFLKRTLLDSQIVADPVLDSVSPTSGDTSQYLEFTLAVDFALPGAIVVFRKEPTAVTVPANQIVLGDNEAVFSLSLASFQKGAYDVEFVNPDGGKDVLVDAFTVANAPAAPSGVAPAFGYDSQVVTATITGVRLSTSGTVALERGAETIPGTSLTGGATQIQAQFDLVDRTVGFWDVVVTSPDAAPARMEDAFEVRNTPPLVTGFAPASNVNGGTVQGTVTGEFFDATPTVRLRRTGSPDIVGTSVVRVSSTSVTAQFSTTAAAPGIWSLVLANPDGATATLPACFRTVGSVADPAKSLDPAGTMDAGPSVAHDATRNEFAVAWLDAASTAWSVYVQRLDASGGALGSAVSVSSSASSVPKRDAAVAWDGTNDQYIVTWSEIRTVTLASTHPSYKTYPSGAMPQVFAQRFRASDLAAQGTNVQISDSTVSNGYVMDQFPNFRSVPVWDSASKNWNITWLQEWDVTVDDFDVLYRTLDPVAGTLSPAITGIAVTPYHEGDPHVAWDPVSKKLAVVYNDYDQVNVRVFVRLNGVTLAQDSSADLVDPRVAVDPDTHRYLVTWTRKPATGNTTVQALLLDGKDPSTKIGSLLTVGSGTGEDHRSARPVYDPASGQAMIAWTRETSAGDLSVRVRRASTAGTSLSLLGTEAEASGGSADEAEPAAILNTVDGEFALFWLKTMTLDSSRGAYKFSLFPGTWTGGELWIHRYK